MSPLLCYVECMVLTEEGRNPRLRAGRQRAGGAEDPPDSAEDAIQVPLHLHQGPCMVQEALAHLLQAGA